MRTSMTPAHSTNQARALSQGNQRLCVKNHPISTMHTNHGFAVTQLIEVEREKHINTHVREHVEKQRQEKPPHLGLAQHRPDRYRFGVRGMGFFEVRHAPHTEHHQGE
jgi:cupin superfamily acireductone dioxygenase involved in methionine salvage